MPPPGASLRAHKNPAGALRILCLTNPRRGGGILPLFRASYLYLLTKNHFSAIAGAGTAVCVPAENLSVSRGDAA